MPALRLHRYGYGARDAETRWLQAIITLVNANKRELVP